MKFRLRLPNYHRIGDYWLLYIPLFIGSINVKSAAGPLMFSERYNHIPNITIGPFRFSWVKFR